MGVFPIVHAFAVLGGKLLNQVNGVSQSALWNSCGPPVGKFAVRQGTSDARPNFSARSGTCFPHQLHHAGEPTLFPIVSACSAEAAAGSRAHLIAEALRARLRDSRARFIGRRCCITAYT
jgi:hypothetical protein